MWYNSEIMNQLVTLNLEAIGWKNCSLKEHIVYEFYDGASQTHLLCSFSEKAFVISDGRPTVNKEFYHGDILSVKNLIKIMLQNSGNLTKE